MIFKIFLFLLGFALGRFWNWLDSLDTAEISRLNQEDD